jgi:hypothetical protein
MNPAESQPLLNATDRNIQTAPGMWRGHITLPSAFLSGGLLLIVCAFLLVIHWCFEEVASIRERLRDHERIIYGFIEKGAATPAPASPK